MPTRWTALRMPAMTGHLSVSFATSWGTGQMTDTNRCSTRRYSVASVVKPAMEQARSCSTEVARTKPDTEMKQRAGYATHLNIIPTSSSRNIGRSSTTRILESPFLPNSTLCRDLGVDRDRFCYRATGGIGGTARYLCSNGQRFELSITHWPGVSHRSRFER